MSALEQLAHFCAKATPPESVTEVVAPAVADCFGCVLAGAGSPVALRVRTGLADVAPGTAKVFGTDLRLSPPFAAMANTVAGHAYELDDWEEAGNTHPSVVMLPAMLAAAHMSPASGQSLLNSYAVGFETIVRLGEAMTLEHYNRGFHATATLGGLGATAAVARLAQLSPEETAHALSIAATQALGFTAQFGSDAKPVQVGFAAQNAIVAVLLARAGATGQNGVFDGSGGYADIMGAATPDRMFAAMNKLGKPWGLEEYKIVIKPWPSCGYTHRLMTAALDLRPRLVDRLDEVSSIQATLPDFHNAILPFAKPANLAEALFSAHACVAQILLKGELSLSDAAANFWQKPELVRLSGLTTVTGEVARNPDLNFDPNQPDTLTVCLKTGEQIKAKCVYPLGAPLNAMSQGQLACKFSSCTGLEPDTFAELLKWPEAKDVSSFFAAFELP